MKRWRFDSEVESLVSRWPPTLSGRTGFDCQPLDTYTPITVRIQPMKTKLTVTIDRNLLPQAKRYARARGVSLSELIEASMRKLGTEAQGPTFSSRWRGKFVPADRKDERYRALAKKYL